MLRTYSFLFIASLLSIAGCAVNATGKATVSVESAPIAVGQGGGADSPTTLDRGDIQWCEASEGSLSKAEAYHQRTFDGAACDSVFVELNGHAGKDMFALLYETDGTGPWHLADWNDDCAGDTLNACITTSVTVGHRYAVIATTYDFMVDRRGHAASYDLTVSCLPKGGTCIDPNATPPVAEGQFCGSRGTGPCPDGQFCDFNGRDTAQACGVSDGGGTCRMAPQGCSKEYFPVCGCDGVTYGNACMAASASTGIAKTGECGRPKQDVGQTCGGIAALQCKEGLFCDYSAIQSCYPDMGGVCTPEKEVLCTRIYKPECGCDGVTYSNACARMGAGAALAHDGKC